MRGVSWRNRKRLAILGAGVLSWLLIAWGGMPLWRRLATLGQEASSSSQRIAQLQELLRRRSAIEQQAQAYAQFAGAASEEMMQRRLLDELEQWAREVNVQLNLKPKAIQRDGAVRRLGVEVELEATQEALLAFLDRIFTAPTLLEVDRLQITSTSAKDASLRAQLTVSCPQLSL